MALPTPTSRRPVAGNRDVAELANGYAGGFAVDCGSVCKEEGRRKDGDGC